MIKQVLSILMVLCLSVTAMAQDDPATRLQKLIAEARAKQQQTQGNTQVVLRRVVYDKLRTPQSEVEDAILFLSKYKEEDRQFIRFFSTYAVPQNQREDIVLTLSFVIHSLVGISKDPDQGNAGGYYPLAKREDGRFKSYRRVPDSATLWWIDLRDYNWTAKAWETMSNLDGYFVEPIVSHDRSGALRLLAGNAIVRADWFIRHSMSTTDQLDLDKDDDIYTTLLYALNQKPSNIDEWRKAWGLDILRARSLGNEYGTLVTKSQAVARHNRMLFGYRTELGYLYETYDVKNMQGKRDYLESLFLNKKPGEPPEISDAGEIFASNMLGLQVYGLRDGAGKLVEFGDPTLVRHMADVIGDARVRVAHSCLDCHASGPIPSENTLMEFVQARVDLKTYDKKDALRLKRTLLSEKFRDSVEDNQKLFARAVKKVNGLETTENGSLYLKAVIEYSKPVTLERAAFECGVTVEELKAAVLKKNARFGARLKLLCTTGEAIPREVWESPGKDGIPGAFQQAMILLNGLTTITDEQVVEEQIVIYEVGNWVRVPIQSGNRVLARVNDGYQLLPTGKITDNYWLEVYMQDGTIGNVALKYVRKTTMDQATVNSVFSKVPAQKRAAIISGK